MQETSRHYPLYDPPIPQSYRRTRIEPDSRLSNIENAHAHHQIQIQLQEIRRQTFSGNERKRTFEHDFVKGKETNSAKKLRPNPATDSVKVLIPVEDCSKYNFHLFSTNCFQNLILNT